MTNGSAVADEKSAWERLRLAAKQTTREIGIVRGTFSQTFIYTLSKKRRG